MRYQIVRGVVVKTLPPGGEHGGIANWAHASNCGLSVVLVDMLMSSQGACSFGSLIPCEGPNVYYVRADRMLSSGTPRNF